MSHGLMIKVPLFLLHMKFIWLPQLKDKIESMCGNYFFEPKIINFCIY